MHYNYTNTHTYTTLSDVIVTKVAQQHRNTRKLEVGTRNDGKQHTNKRTRFTRVSAIFPPPELTRNKRERRINKLLDIMFSTKTVGRVWFCVPTYPEKKKGFEDYWSCLYPDARNIHENCSL